MWMAGSCSRSRHSDACKVDIDVIARPTASRLFDDLDVSSAEAGSSRDDPRRLPGADMISGSSTQASSGSTIESPSRSGIGHPSWLDRRRRSTVN